MKQEEGRQLGEHRGKQHLLNVHSTKDCGLSKLQLIFGKHFEVVVLSLLVRDVLGWCILCMGAIVDFVSDPIGITRSWCRRRDSQAF